LKIVEFKSVRIVIITFYVLCQFPSTSVGSATARCCFLPPYLNLMHVCPDTLTYIVSFLLPSSTIIFLDNANKSSLDFCRIFPTRYRCTCHEISAACGKMGSTFIRLIVSQPGFANLPTNIGWVLGIFAVLMFFEAKRWKSWRTGMQRLLPRSRMDTVRSLVSRVYLRRCSARWLRGGRNRGRAIHRGRSALGWNP